MENNSNKKRILIVSDTHRNQEKLKKILKLEKEAGEIDALIHCGDVEGMEDEITRIARCQCYMVAGNNDFFSPLPNEQLIDINGVKLWITHGHFHRVSLDLSYIRDEAMHRGVDVVCFGHTHMPLLEKTDGLLLLNPGSVSYPRQQNRTPSYAIMTIDAQGNMSCEIRYFTS